MSNNIIDKIQLSGVTYDIGGSGGGVTSGEVQTMIDEAVSGKANSSDVYTTGQTSGATEIANALNAKLDATAYTPTVVDSALNMTSTNPVQNQALYSELRISNGGETETTLVIENNHSINYPSGCTKLKVEVVGSNNYSIVDFSNANQNLGTINIFNYGSISVDNSYFQAATYEISGTTVIFSYPTVTNVTKIVTSGDGGNSTWSFKAIVETPAVPLKDVVNGLEPKVDAAWENGVKAPSLGYDTISGITLSSLPISGGNYNYSSIATDDSLKSDNESVLGVYTTGATHTVNVNPILEKVDRCFFNSIPSNIKMYWNSSYTGNTSNYIAVDCVVNDGTNGYCQWYWKNGEYVPNTNYINTAVTLTYDSTNQVVTITPSSSSALASIHYVRCSKYIAPSSALTQDDCRIGLVTIDTNSYKLQEALDNKQDTLSAGTNITIVDNVISAQGGGTTYTAGVGIDITNDVISVTGKVDTTTYNTYTAATDTALASKQTTLTAGTGISIVDNVISATGGGGMTEDMERLISTALVDLNDRKIDASEVKSNYQKKGDYATKSALDLKANSSEVMTLDKSKENELVTAAALNSINERLIALETAVQALQTLHNNE